MRWELETGHHDSIDACANATVVTDSYFARIVRLAYLAPDITTAILDDRQPAKHRHRKNPRRNGAICA